jgi:hypothetical protein
MHCIDLISSDIIYTTKTSLLCSYIDKNTTITSDIMSCISGSGMRWCCPFLPILEVETEVMDLCSMFYHIQLKNHANLQAFVVLHSFRISYAISAVLYYFLLSILRVCWAWWVFAGCAERLLSVLCVRSASLGGTEGGYSLVFRVQV